MNDWGGSKSTLGKKILNIIVKNPPVAAAKATQATASQEINDRLCTFSFMDPSPMDASGCLSVILSLSVSSAKIISLQF